MAACPFCAIGDAEQSASVLHEDERTLAFLDETPVEGHALVIPKDHRAELPGRDDDATEVAAAVLKSEWGDRPASTVLRCTRIYS